MVTERESSYDIGHIPEYWTFAMDHTHAHAHKTRMCLYRALGTHREQSMAKGRCCEKKSLSLGCRCRIRQCRNEVVPANLQEPHACMCLCVYVCVCVCVYVCMCVWHVFICVWCISAHARGGIRHTEG
jgi:hypothetical protein